MRWLRCAGDPLVCRLCRRAVGAAGEPHVVSPRVDPQVPVFALGRYAGVRRQAILAMKEHGRRDLVAPLACALIVGVDHLLSWGMLENPLTMVPAPTRRWAARRRGGDPSAGWRGLRVPPLGATMTSPSSRRCGCER